jgi:hypothetical protein
MSATTVFDLRSILSSSIQTAIDLARQGGDVTVDQVMEKVMASVNIQEIQIAPVKVKNSRVKKSASESEPEPKEKVERVRAAPAKPRAIPDDETRCCARSLYEKDHTEAGKLKVMRDDEANLYGDRCKFKKVGEADFCKHHSEKQPLGVWGGEYSGKFQVLVEKLSAPEVEKKPKAANDKPKSKAKPAPEEPVCQIASEDEEEEEPVAEVKPKAAEVKPKAAEPVIKAVAPEEPEDEEPLEVEECQIDGKTYMRDAENNIYDEDTDDLVGQYNFKTKKWIKRV